VWFQANALDIHGFVVDFSSLGALQAQLAEQFDHTFLVNADDPLLEQWQALHEQGALDLRVMDNVGMEASAQLVWQWANALLQARDGGRSCCWKVEARENEKNAACFEAQPEWFSQG
jgi:6-pyruvoyltetrahydropterin/6-carboxytetrahydropterin synthase